MNVKKIRQHFQGSSNKDYKYLSKDELKGPFNKIIDNLSIPKNKYREILKNLRNSHIEKNPILDTKMKYSNKNNNNNKRKKTYNSWAKISLPRLNHLEEKDKRKLVFTGDSLNNYDIHCLNKKNSNIKENKNSIVKKKVKKKLDRKKNEHAEAQIETQQVSLPQFLKTTLSGKINVDKVKEVKRALHRRYGNAKNLQKIFNAWDSESKGMITVGDLYTMLNKLGLKMNKEECNILMSISDKDNNKNLTIDEFYELIHNQEFNILNNVNVINALIENETNPSEKETFNKIKKLIEVKKKLKNYYTEIKKQLPQTDENKNGFITKNNFYEFFKKLNLNENLLKKEEIDILYKSNLNEKGFDYKNFITDLCKLQVDTEETFLAKFLKGKDKTWANFVLENINKKNNGQISKKIKHKDMNWNIILNSYNKIELIRRKISNLDDRISINDFIKNHKNQNISFDETKKVLDEYYKKLNIKFTKRDKELLLGILDFNKDGFTEKNKIEVIFEKESELELLERVNLRLKGPLNKLPLDKNYNTDIEKLKKISIDYNLKNSNPKIFKVLRKIDNNIFINFSNFQNFYKFFDYNKDGYIDRNDLYYKFNELNFLDKKEINLALDFFEKENNNKPHYKFKDFHRIFSNNLQNNNLKQYDKRISNLLKNNREDFLTYMRKIKDGLKPENNLSILIRINKYKIYH